VGEHDERRGSSRRTFLIQLAAVGASGSLLASCARAVAGAGAAGGAASRDLIGLQMYTVRDLLAKDFEGTVEQVARIGYKNLEFAGYYNRTPETVRALLDKFQLVSTSSHIGGQLMQQDAAAQIRAAKTIGQQYITLPSYNFTRGSLESWKSAAKQFNTWGAMCRDAGLRLAYHNHNFEFAPLEGTTGFDVLAGETDPALVDFELDLYWATFAGQDPLALFAKYPGRFAMWHVKDMSVTGTTKGMTPVGQGTIDFKTIFAHAEQSGLRHFFVEHDSAAQYPGGSLASITASIDYLRRLLA
jgi:sugar phosphate isomerase/epimerase